MTNHENEKIQNDPKVKDKIKSLEDMRSLDDKIKGDMDDAARDKELLDRQLNLDEEHNIWYTKYADRDDVEITEDIDGKQVAKLRTLTPLEQKQKHMMKLLELVRTFGPTLTVRQQARMIGCSIRTVQRLWKWFKEETLDELKEMHRIGYIYENRMARLEMETLKNRLYKMLENAEKERNYEMVLKITSNIEKMIMCNQKLLNVPTLSAFGIKEKDK